MEGLNGTNYRAAVRLSDADDVTVADVGETCERVPATSLGWLLEQCLIEPVSVDEPAVPTIAPVETAVDAPVETRAEGDA